jgi:hypothetical protein
VNFVFTLAPLGFIGLSAPAPLPDDPTSPIQPAAGFQGLIGSEAFELVNRSGNRAGAAAQQKARCLPPSGAGATNGLSGDRIAAVYGCNSGSLASSRPPEAALARVGLSRGQSGERRAVRQSNAAAPIHAGVGVDDDTHGERGCAAVRPEFTDGATGRPERVKGAASTGQQTPTDGNSASRARTGTPA